MRTRSLKVLGAGVGAAVLVALGGCSPSPEPVDVTKDAVIVDVRTPAEFAAGHLEGAVNLNLESPDFEHQVAALDGTEEYIVYCQSGNRSSQAFSVMEAQGLEVMDAGGIAQAEESTGLDVVN
ncbi:rhodanese-like domain-containing protein [Demequina flava]|uniref:rhodanese-like domain-containing protein n=1 Tax=Demequina flava TaxID=1095025 RepID=UPI00078606E4|nr:rhodanese-like domain-containing protein [Demequina flava]